MACYAIGHIEVTDAERYKEYAFSVLAQVSRIGGRCSRRAGRPP